MGSDRYHRPCYQKRPTAVILISALTSNGLTPCSAPWPSNIRSPNSLRALWLFAIHINVRGGTGVSCNFADN